MNHTLSIIIILFASVFMMSLTVAFLGWIIGEKEKLESDSSKRCIRLEMPLYAVNNILDSLNRESLRMVPNDDALLALSESHNKGKWDKYVQIRASIHYIQDAVKKTLHN